jgi:hypothetical protein
MSLFLEGSGDYLSGRLGILDAFGQGAPKQPPLPQLGVPPANAGLPAANVGQPADYGVFGSKENLDAIKAQIASGGASSRALYELAGGGQIQRPLAQGGAATTEFIPQGLPSGNTMASTPLYPGQTPTGSGITGGLFYDHTEPTPTGQTPQQPTSIFGNFNPNAGGTNMDAEMGTAGLLGLLTGQSSMQDLLGGAAGYTLINEGINQARNMPNQLGQAAGAVSQQVADAAEFRPYSVTSGSGSVGFGKGGLNIQTTPQGQQYSGGLQGYANAAQGQLGQGANNQFLQQAGQQVGQNSGSMLNNLASQFGQMAGNSGEAISADSIYNDIRAMQRPEEQRAQQALDEKLAAQGRLGVSTAQYGGTPEQLAMAKAMEESKAGASLSAMQEADRMRTSQLARQTSAGQLAGNLGQAGNTMNAQDILNAANLQGLGQSQALFGQQLDAGALQNIINAQTGSYLPENQVMAQTDRGLNFGGMLQNPASMQAQAIADLGRQAMTGIPDSVNAEAALRQAQLDVLSRTLGMGAGGSGGSGGAGGTNYLEQGLGALGGLFGGIFGDDSAISDESFIAQQLASGGVYDPTGGTGYDMFGGQFDFLNNMPSGVSSGADVGPLTMDSFLGNIGGVSYDDPVLPTIEIPGGI